MRPIDSGACRVPMSSVSNPSAALENITPTLARMSSFNLALAKPHVSEHPGTRDLTGWHRSDRQSQEDARESRTVSRRSSECTHGTLDFGQGFSFWGSEAGFADLELAKRLTEGMLCGCVTGPAIV